MKQNLIKRALEESVANLQTAGQHLEFVEKNERLTEHEVMEIEALLVLLNTAMAKCDKSTGEIKRSKITTV